MALNRALIIGGGYPQLCLIEAAVAQGYATTVVDDRENCPGIQVAEESIPINRYDLEGIEVTIRESHYDMITSAGADKAVLIACKLAWSHNLPFYVSPDVAVLPTRKGEFRALIEEWGLPCPRTRRLSSVVDIEKSLCGFKFPIVVKPDDGIGQSAVNRVNSMEMVRAAVQAALEYSASDKAIIEEFIEGPEIGVNGFIDGAGEFHLLVAVNRVASRDARSDFGVALAKEVPFGLSATQEEALRSIFQQATDCLSLRNSPIYAQVILANCGNFRIIEMMPRLGGGEDPRIVEFVTGFRMCDAVLDASIGKSIRMEDYRESPRARRARMMFLTAQPGIIQEIRGFPMDDHHILYQEMYVRAGTVVGEIKSSRDRLGVVIFGAETVREIEELASAVSETIEVVTI